MKDVALFLIETFLLIFIAAILIGNFQGIDKVGFWIEVALLVLISAHIIHTLRTNKCPKCGRRLWRRQIAKEKTPGSEYEKQTMTNRDEGPKTAIYARYEVTYMCPRCGYREQRTEDHYERDKS